MVSLQFLCKARNVGLAAPGKYFLLYRLSEQKDSVHVLSCKACTLCSMLR